jgi:hypothetical protein
MHPNGQDANKQRREAGAHQQPDDGRPDHLPHAHVRTAFCIAVSVTRQGFAHRLSNSCSVQLSPVASASRLARVTFTVARSTLLM